MIILLDSVACADESAEAHFLHGLRSHRTMSQACAALC